MTRGNEENRNMNIQFVDYRGWRRGHAGPLGSAVGDQGWEHIFRQDEQRDEEHKKRV